MKEVLNLNLSKSVFIKWVVLLPTFLLGMYFGIILIHIILSFSFEIPMFIRATGILTGIWVWISIFLYAKISPLE